MGRIFNDVGLRKSQEGKDFWRDAQQLREVEWSKTQEGEEKKKIITKVIGRSFK